MAQLARLSSRLEGVPRRDQRDNCQAFPFAYGPDSSEVVVVDSGDRETSGTDLTVDRQLSIDEQTTLTDAVRALECIRDPEQRQLVVSAIQRHGGGNFNPPRFNTARSDVYSIVDACLAANLMPMLVKITGAIGGMTDNWSALNELVANLFARDVVLVIEFAQIQEHLKALTREGLTEVLSSPLLKQRVELAALPSPTATEAYRQFELAAAEPGGVLRLLVFLELVGHRFEDRDSATIHATIDGIAARRGLTNPIARICRNIYLTRGPGETLQKLPDSTNLPDNVGTISAGPTTGDEDPVKPTSTHPGSFDLGVTAAPAVWGGVPPRNRNFTGRNDLLDEIRRLLRHRTQAAVLAHALGLGGVGKTQLAMEYVYLHQAEYELVWWIPAGDERAIKRSLVSLGKRLGLVENQDVEQTVENVLEELRQGKPTRNWLLVFDNAAGPLVVRPYLLAGPGQILITSRDQDWYTAGSSVRVNVFAPEESMALLRRRWPALTDEEALTLADRLGHLPLALEQAVALHVRTGMPLEEYLRNLGEKPAALLGEDVALEYRRSVADTFRMGYNELKATSPAAAQLLELCAFLSSHPISIQMLIRGRGADLPEPLRATLRDDILLRRAVRELGQLSLAQLDTGRELISVHMLVGAVLRAELANENRSAAMELAAHSILAAANPGQPDNPATWSQHAQIAPHIDDSGIIHSDDRDARQTVLDQVRYLYDIGDYAASQALGKTVVENWRARFGQDDPTTLVGSRHWADALRAMGERLSALEVNRDTLARMRTVLGEDHEHTLATANGYGADLRLLGRFNEAKQLDQANYHMYEQVLGDDDPATLRSFNSLALDERLLGNFDASSAIQVEIRDRCVSVLGEEHLQTLLSYSNLTRDYYGLGQYKLGLELQEEKLPILRNKLRPGHVWMLLAQRYYAILLRKCGNHQEALKEAEQNYADCQLYLRRSHELTLAATITLCNALRASGDLEQAKSVGEEALDAYREGFGEGHPFTLACATDYAIVLRALGKLEEATELDDVTYAKLSERLGERHPHTLCSAAGRATNLANAEKINEALVLSKAVYELSKSVRRPDHPTTLACAANLALDLAAVGDDTGAAVLRHDTSKRMRRELGEKHPELANFWSEKRAECDIEIPPT